MSAPSPSSNKRKRPLSPSLLPPPSSDEPSLPSPSHEDSVAPTGIYQGCQPRHGAGDDGYIVEWLHSLSTTTVDTDAKSACADNAVEEDEALSGTASEGTTAVIEAIRNVTIVLQGRGYLENVTLPRVSSGVSTRIEVHGVVLEPLALSDMQQNHDGMKSRPLLVPFDSPSWSSWITVPLRSGCRLKIYSDFEIDDVSNVSSRQEQRRGPSFAVFAATDRQARPTVIPDSWERAADAIVADYNKYATDSSAGPHQEATAQVSFVQTASFFSDSLTSGDEADPSVASEAPTMHLDDNEIGDLPNGINHDRDGFQIAICGAKSVGKSTCLRYCLNRMLSSRRCVAVLDADPGQPEYCAPGMLQLSLVSSPTLLPPHRHLQASSRGDQNALHRHYRPIQSHYFGSVTSSTDPLTYLRCVSSLVQAYKEQVLQNDESYPNGTPPPLLINLDGWIKDLGFDILTTLLQETLQPSHIIQIAGDSLSKTLDLSSSLPTLYGNGDDKCQLHSCWAYNSSRNNPHPIAKGNGDHRGKGIDESSPTEPCLDAVKTTNVNASSASVLVPYTPSIPATALRAVRLVTYFMSGALSSETTSTRLTATNLWDQVSVGAQGLDDPACDIALALAAARPFVVNLDSVRIRFTVPDTHRDIATESRLLDAVNGSVVGLCHDATSDGDKNRHHETNNPAALLPCVGLGIVRAIDHTRRLLYILTPCHENELRSRAVNCLTVGSNVHLPLECYLRGAASEAFPHIAFVDGIEALNSADPPGILGSDPMKSRNSINRRGQGGSS